MKKKSGGMAVGLLRKNGKGKGKRKSGIGSGVVEQKAQKILDRIAFVGD